MKTSTLPSARAVFATSTSSHSRTRAASAACRSWWTSSACTRQLTSSGTFQIGRRLFAGNALLFAYEALGNTIDFEQIDNIGVTFFGGAAAVERAIAAGIIDRPTFSVNGETVWQWPQPRPDLNAVAERSTKGDRTT
jgi:hypothetical protein